MKTLSTLTWITQTWTTHALTRSTRTTHAPTLTYQHQRRTTRGQQLLPKRGRATFAAEVWVILVTLICSAILASVKQAHAMSTAWRHLNLAPSTPLVVQVTAT